jgi:hypothetical protein
VSWLWQSWTDWDRTGTEKSDGPEAAAAIFRAMGVRGREVGGMDCGVGSRDRDVAAGTATWAAGTAT